MKLLLFILALLGLCSALPQLGGYERVETFEVQNSTEIQQFINLALERIVQEGSSKAQISNTDFQLGKINNIYKQVLDGENYKFDCEFKNSQSQVIRASFEVNYQRSTSITQLTTYSYEIKTVNVIQSVQDSYVQVGAQEVQYSSEIQKILKLGVDQAIAKSIAAKSIASSVYQISNVNIVSKQVIESALFYKCDVDVKSKEGITVQATFTIYYQPFLNVTSLVDYVCNVKSTANTISNTTSVNNQTDTTQLDTTTVQQDAVANEVLQYGINEILQKGFSSGKMPKAEYSLVQIVSASKKSQNGRDTYKFECSLQNSNGVTVQMTFTVSYQVSTKTKTITAYSYNVRNISKTTTSLVIAPVDGQYTAVSSDEVSKDTTIQAVLQYGVDQVIQAGVSKGKIPASKFNITQVTEAYRQVVGNTVFYKFSCTLQSTKTTTLQMTFTVSYQAATNQKQVTAYSYNLKIGSKVSTSQSNTTTNTSTTQSIEGTYIPCNQTEITNDTVIQEVLAYGAQEIYIRGVQEQKVSASNFTVKSVNSVSKQSVTDKGTLYKCDVTMDNSAGSTLTIKFTILYQLSTKQKSITEYSYQVSTKSVTATNTTDQGNYTNISIDKAQNDTVIQSNINYGIGQVLQKAVESGKIKSTNFDITKIVTVSQKSQTSTTLYKCEVELSNTEGSVMAIAFIVEYQSSTKKQSLKSYSFNVKTVSKAVQAIEAAYVKVDQSEVDHSTEIQGCLSYGIEQVIQNSTNYTTTNIKNVQRQIVEGALYYKFEVELNNAKQTVTASFTVFFKPDTGERNVRAYSCNTKTVSTSTSSVSSSSKYNKTETSKIQTTTKYRNALDFGVKECLQNLYNKSVITTTDFKVSTVTSFLQQISQSEKYKFKATLTNVDGISLQVSLEVQYKAGALSLVSYAVEGSTLTNQRQALLAEYKVYNSYELLIGSYEKIASSEISTNSDVKTCVDYGVQETVKQITKKEKFTVNDFKVKEIKSVCRDSVNRETYRVESTMVNSQGMTIDCSFLVKSQISGAASASQQLTSYGYITY